jgi:protein KRI1
LLEIAQQAKEYGAREVEALHNPSDSDSESSSEEEDENGELLTPEMDIEIMRTIAAIRRKDPRVYQKDAVFYSGK